MHAHKHATVQLSIQAIRICLPIKLLPRNNSKVQCIMQNLQPIGLLQDDCDIEHKKLLYVVLSINSEQLK